MDELVFGRGADPSARGSDREEGQWGADGGADAAQRQSRVLHPCQPAPRSADPVPAAENLRSQLAQQQTPWQSARC